MSSLRYDYKSARYGDGYDDPRADELALAVSDFEQRAIIAVSRDYATRHDSPHLLKLLDIDPDEPESVAASAVIAIRPLLEDLMFAAIAIAQKEGSKA